MIKSWPGHDGPMQEHVCADGLEITIKKKKAKSRKDGFVVAPPVS